MAFRFPAALRRLLLGLMIFALAVAPGRAQFGLVNDGIGPIGRVIPTVAAGIDAPGAIYWNPASISGLERSEFASGIDAVFPRSTLSSTVDAGALGLGLPFHTLSGSDKADNGVYPLPYLGLVYKPDDSPWAFGLGIFSVGGFSVNYPASTTNPVLTPQPPQGIGLGSIYSQLVVLEINPVVSYRLTDHLSFGIGPAIGLANVKVDPALIASPDAARTGIFPTYPFGTHAPFIWGGGAEAGLFYTLDQGWRLGASIKSPRWFEKERFQSQDQAGGPRFFTFRADVPMIVSAGVTYAGFDRWLFAIDTHYIDYGNATGLRQSGFDPTGAVLGIGWRSIWAIALGAQYRMTDGLTVRAGYTWNQNPIDSQHAFFNVASPAIRQNAFTVGATYQVTEDLSFSAAYGYAFQNSVSGPFVLPGGSLPGTNVTSTGSGQLLVLGATVRFGGSKCKRPAAPAVRVEPPATPECSDGGSAGLAE
jgi:long-chain fatty acid transport protein